MDNTFNIDSPYLEHYGILGMKWGIRRYQNPDGTLTAAGRRRVKRAMKQHDVVMTTRDTHERDKEYKRFRDIVTQMYPAEIADLTLKVEQANAIKKLSDLQTEDKIKRGLEYTSSVMDIISKTGTAVGNFASAANTLASMRYRNEQVKEKALTNEKNRAEWEKENNPLKDIKDAIDAGKKTKEGIEILKETVNKATETEEQRKERERRQKSVPDSARKDYKKADEEIFKNLAANGYNKQEIYNVYNDFANKHYTTSTPQADIVKELLKDDSNYGLFPKKLRPRSMAQSSIFKMDGNFYIIPSNSDLQHHGVLGMKWGVRRYQNKDGSLTNAGRKRYGSEGFRSKEQYQNRLNDLDTATHIIDKKIETRQNIKGKLIESKARTDSYIDFDGGTVGERVKSKLLDKAISKVDDDINRKAINKEKGYQEMANIIQKLQDSGFKITTKPTIKNVNTGADYVANLIAGPSAALAYGATVLDVLPLVGFTGPVAAPLAAGIVGSAILGTSIYSLTKNTTKGTKFKVEEGG